MTDTEEGRVIRTMFSEGVCYVPLRDYNDIARQLAEANRQIAEGKAQWDRVAVSLSADKDCVDSVFAKAEQVSQLVERAEAAERRAVEFEQVLSKAYGWREKLHRCLRRGHHCEATVAADAVKQAIDAAIAAGEREGG